MNKSTFAVLLASALAMFQSFSVFADQSPIEVCPDMGLVPPPGGTCTDLLPPPPPSRKCEQYSKTKKNDGKPLSDQEFNYFLKRGGTFNLLLCEPLLSKAQRKKFEKAMRDAELRFKFEEDDRFFEEK